MPDPFRQLSQPTILENYHNLRKVLSIFLSILVNFKCNFDEATMEFGPDVINLVIVLIALMTGGKQVSTLRLQFEKGISREETAPV